MEIFLGKKPALFSPNRKKCKFINTLSAQTYSKAENIEIRASVKAEAFIVL